MQYFRDGYGKIIIIAQRGVCSLTNYFLIPVYEGADSVREREERRQEEGEEASFASHGI